MSDGHNSVSELSTRRAFLAKVAAYSAPLVLGGQFLGFGGSSASGAVGECSATSSLSTLTGVSTLGESSESAGQSSLTTGESAGDGSGGGNTPHESLLADLDTLNSLTGSGSAAGRQLAGAIRLLTHATEDALWPTGYTLELAHGSRVFTELGMTAAMLVRTGGI